MTATEDASSPRGSSGQTAGNPDGPRNLSLCGHLRPLRLVLLPSSRSEVQEPEVQGPGPGGSETGTTPVASGQVPCTRGPSPVSSVSARGPRIRVARRRRQDLGCWQATPRRSARGSGLAPPQVRAAPTRLENAVAAAGPGCHATRNPGAAGAVSRSWGLARAAKRGRRGDPGAASLAAEASGRFAAVPGCVAARPSAQWLASGISVASGYWRATPRSPPEPPQAPPPGSPPGGTPFRASPSATASRLRRLAGLRFRSL